MVATLAVVVLAGFGMRAHAGSYSQNFETDTAGWFAGDQGSPSTNYGAIDRVSSGTAGIPAAGGSGYYAQVYDNTPDGSQASASTTFGPYTHFGMNTAGDRAGSFSPFVTSIAIYLDPSWSTGSGFDYSVSATNTSGSFLRDFIFHVSENATGDGVLLGASNNSSDGLPQAPGAYPGGSPTVTTAGWYTFKDYFFNNGGQLGVEMTVLIRRARPSSTKPSGSSSDYWWRRWNPDYGCSR